MGDCFCHDTWDEERIRRACQDGTEREWRAYIEAGYILPPSNSTDDYRQTCKEIALEIVAEHGITVEELISRSRRLRLVAARKAFIKKCAKSGKQLSIVARFLQRDHTTISYHMER